MTDYAATRFSAEITARLRGLIARYDVNQADLAILCDVSQSQFSKIVRGVRPITVDQLAALCEALDIDMTQLIDEVEKFLEPRDNASASPVRYVDEGDRLPRPVTLQEYALDGWAINARARLGGRVGGQREDYDLVANETINEMPVETDADYDNA